VFAFATAAVEATTRTTGLVTDIFLFFLATVQVACRASEVRRYTARKADLDRSAREKQGQNVRAKRRSMELGSVPTERG
jgi:hypothetical protein